MPGVELNAEPALSVQWNGVQFGARRFRVWGGPTREMICYQPQQIALDNGTTLPALRSSLLGMYLDSYTAVGLGSGLYDVTALYSSEQQRQKTSCSFQSENVPIPYCIRGTSLLPSYIAATTLPTIQRFGWEIQEQMFITSVARTFLTVYYSTTNREDPFVSTIQSKINELHRPFGGGWYRFEAADVVYLGGFNIAAVELDQYFYQISYAWVYESGLRLPQGWNQSPAALDQVVKYPDGAVSLLPGGGEGADWLLPPFHKLIPVRATDQSGTGNAAMPFNFDAVMPYTINEFGWQALPGIV